MKELNNTQRYHKKSKIANKNDNFINYYLIVI